MPRKPRPPQGALATLTSEQRQRLDEMLFDENKIYAEVLSFLESSYGIKTSDGSLSAYYQKHAFSRLRNAIADAADASTARGSGVEITIVCQRAGEIRLAIRPLHGVEASSLTGSEAATIRAAGLEVVVVSERPGEIHLAVLPLQTSPTEALE